MQYINEIPQIVHPLGRHWRQPDGLRAAPMDDTHVLLTSAQVRDLPEYSSTYPSGTYDGKCWKRDCGNHMRLCWYHPHTDPKLIGIGSREIIEVKS